MALTEFTVPNKNGSYDGGMVIKNYTSLNIAAGNVVSTDQPCRGMIIYVSGDCTISGTLTMTGRGAATPNLNGEVTALFNSVPGIFYPYLPPSGAPTPPTSHALWTALRPDSDCPDGPSRPNSNCPDGPGDRTVTVRTDPADQTVTVRTDPATGE